MRFNEDLGTLEFYTGDEWRTVNSYLEVMLLTSSYNGMDMMDQIDEQR